MREFAAIMASGTLWANEAATLVICLVMERHNNGTTMQQGKMNDALANKRNAIQHPCAFLSIQHTNFSVPRTMGPMHPLLPLHLLLRRPPPSGPRL
jgi:hypothetical protein